jgi:hypothetical protein
MSKGSISMVLHKCRLVCGSGSAYINMGGELSLTLGIELSPTKKEVENWMNLGHAMIVPSIESLF